MKFNFKIQAYQTEAVDSVIDVFQGQPYINNNTYIWDRGKVPDTQQESLYQNDKPDDIGYSNADILLADAQLLQNIKAVQRDNNIKLSDKLIKEGNSGRCSLDIEMETGTGKTYVYIKTMFELNAKYGWSKFIVVVPSIAIREGVKKSFEMTQAHFMEYYHKKANYFIYDSNNLNQIDNDFAKSSDISVMIINSQAFTKSMNENKSTGAKANKAARKIYSVSDEFQSRRPIDVIKANRPILILDEPQKMGGPATQKALKNFNALFTLNYSATHAKHHNLVYVLDSLDAYNKKLVKKIAVKALEVRNLKGAHGYLFLQNIILSPDKPPQAKLEFEIKLANGFIKRKTRIVSAKPPYDLYSASNELEQYKGYIITDISAEKNLVRFMNGETISTGQILGAEDEQETARIQIRETIRSHFDKEERLYNLGIKTLSLFFVDEVAKYRLYDTDGGELTGEYGRIFEEEYADIYNECYNKLLKLGEKTPYLTYLEKHCARADKVHKGYFAIDKKTNHFKDGTEKELAKDIPAYDLILKNKERLLSFDEPTRFIFSHSALREGWDNPNIFQICALKRSGTSVSRRQEVGRGLRLCVDERGNRMDFESCGDDVQDINLLTVISSGSYAAFVDELQKELKDNLYDRPVKASMEYFIGKSINGTVINETQARYIYQYLVKNNYVDENDKITDKYHSDYDNNTLVPLPDKIVELGDGITKLMQNIFDEKTLDDMIEDANIPKTSANELNKNFYKKEFQTLWNYINHKCSYTVQFDSEELIQKAIDAIDSKLKVAPLQYVLTEGKQNEHINKEDIQEKTSITLMQTQTKTTNNYVNSFVKYDLIGKIARGSVLTRKTAASILKRINPAKFAMFKTNPEEFISKVIDLIKEQKGTMIVEHICYQPRSDADSRYSSNIFTADKHKDYSKAFEAAKHIQPFVFTDGSAENSVEKRFAKELDNSSEVSVYAKLPKGFKIPTPVGNYTPDWAIAFHEGSVKHIYFVAETKGSMSSLQLKTIEQIKIECAKKLFAKLNNGIVKYDVVDSYESLMNIIC